MILLCDFSVLLLVLLSIKRLILAIWVSCNIVNYLKDESSNLHLIYVSSVRKNVFDKLKFIFFVSNISILVIFLLIIDNHPSPLFPLKEIYFTLWKNPENGYNMQLYISLVKNHLSNLWTMTLVRCKGFVKIKFIRVFNAILCLQYNTTIYVKYICWVLCRY